MIYVRYQPSSSEEPTIYRVPEGKDPFDLCERARARIFPGEKPPARDKVFDGIMKRRELEAKDAGG